MTLDDPDLTLNGYFAFFTVHICLSEPTTQARNQGGRSRRTTPVRRQKVRLVLQVKESIRACNNFKIVSSHPVFTSLLPNEVAFY